MESSRYLLIFVVLALASSFGLSIWVTFTAAIILVTWIVYALFKNRKEEEHLLFVANRLAWHPVSDEFDNQIQRDYWGSCQGRWWNRLVSGVFMDFVGKMQFLFSVVFLYRFLLLAEHVWLIVILLVIDDGHMEGFHLTIMPWYT